MDYDWDYDAEYDLPRREAEVVGQTVWEPMVGVKTGAEVDRARQRIDWLAQVMTGEESAKLWRDLGEDNGWRRSEAIVPMVFQAQPHLKWSGSKVGLGESYRMLGLARLITEQGEDSFHAHGKYLCGLGSLAEGRELARAYRERGDVLPVDEMSETRSLGVSPAWGVDTWFGAASHLQIAELLEQGTQELLSGFDGLPVFREQVLQGNEMVDLVYGFRCAEPTQTYDETSGYSDPREPHVGLFVKRGFCLLRGEDAYLGEQCTQFGHFGGQNGYVRRAMDILEASGLRVGGDGRLPDLGSVAGQVAVVRAGWSYAVGSWEHRHAGKLFYRSESERLPEGSLDLPVRPIEDIQREADERDFDIGL